MNPLPVVIGLLVFALGLPGLRRLLRGRKPLLADELRRFFGTDPLGLPIVSRTFASVDLPNLHLAISQLGKSRPIGYTSVFGQFHNGLREMIAQDGMFQRVNVGPVQYRQVDVDVDQQVRCVENGIHLIDAPGGKLAAHVRTDMMRGGALELEVMAPSHDAASAFIEQVREWAQQANVYRGKILSLECQAELHGHGSANIRFHRFPAVQRDEIILPEETMAMIERNTVGFFRHAAVLRRSGRSVKRGLLLHGKPGTGKTYTAKWLAGSMDGVTTILLSGEQLWLIKECCQMARMLAPSLVIMEDVDLIATERDETRHPAYQITLHQLLNEMDGLESNAEVIFLLTTNRPNDIEPALAARPGRIDQAIEYPLPDADGRRRLIDLYGRGLTLELADPDNLVARTEGASPAFIQELLRKAALFAAEEDSRDNGGLRVTDAHCDAALRELVVGGGELTQNLLGFGRADEEEARPPARGSSSRRRSAG